MVENNVMTTCRHKHFDYCQLPINVINIPSDKKKKNNNNNVCIDICGSEFEWFSFKENKMEDLYVILALF